MSLEFRDPEIDDKSWIQKILNQEKKINTESAFGTCYLWADHYFVKICRYKNMLLKKLGTNCACYEFPRGAKCAEDLQKSLKAIISDAKENGYAQLTFTHLLDPEVQKIEEAFPGKFKFIPKRDKFEYIYKIRDLALLPGKKYHNKRNHISKFSKMFDWKYKPLIPTHKDRYLNFFEKWFGSRIAKKSSKNEGEHTAIKKALENYEALGLLGAVIEIDGEIIACTIGEGINKDVFSVYFEKALPEFKGAYSVINNEFCKTLLGKYKFINREEDMGIPGLRKSKLSYKPAILLPKYDAVLNTF